MKGDGVGDLAQHGEAERCGCWKEMMQELGREVESAGAELVGVVRRGVKGDGVGDLAQHGEAERYGCWEEMTQELGREAESAGAELLGVVRRGVKGDGVGISHSMEKRSGAGAGRR